MALGCTTTVPAHSLLAPTRACVIAATRSGQYEVLAFVTSVLLRWSLNIPRKHQAELAKICESLRKAQTAQPNECRQIVSQVLKRTEHLAESIARTPSRLGRKGGRKTAERGSEWFRQLAAMRKTKAGGRPRKQAK